MQMAIGLLAVKQADTMRRRTPCADDATPALRFCHIGPHGFERVQNASAEHMKHKL